MGTDLFEVIIIALLLYIGYLGKFYLPNYFKKKAENLAQSQDIEHLTTLIKEVEFKFEERTQNLKAKLDLTNQLQLGLYNEERNSLINLHSVMYDFYTFVSDVSLGGIDIQNNKLLEEHLKMRFLKSDNFFHAKNNTMLFVDQDDNGIEEIMHEIFEDINKFSEHYLDYSSGLRNHNMSYNENFSKDELNVFSAKVKCLNDKYIKEVSAMIEIVGPKLTEGTRRIKGYLSKKVS
ncbi:hypothetical protein BC749_109100 [Flavobacterium araucananum]|uniref:Uncharacterized protein n=1 Tax=Flavobacterium araucananum TaxID=946678 RepID=A0A227P7F9_9FLAO|nr:hypothetical protein [Flavobacterium araucananum]OXG05106.1 hypothetical protein B0A64_13840 [Flavobacterium araucananum]PWJ96823.1 hypothetical protein BC749_109100 [Flavobacterium araucananum]